ncbi:glycoside hydrolase family 3 protein [Lachnospiraceae bacterium OttesenSCG-928-D06]|nr:glycoside hydrolase family 3 protein [Lachnospiraceae bacterium OttesenSCG-928-D06]
MNNNSQLEQEKRDARKSRRRKNQISAYLTLLVFIVVVALGVVTAVNFIMDKSKDNNVTENQNKVDDLVATEEELVVPETDDIEETQDDTQGDTSLELTEQEKLDEIINASIEVMPIEDKVAGLFVVTPESITGVQTAIKAGEGTKEALGKYAVGGIVYFAKNMQSKEQLTEMISNTLTYSKYPLFIAVDEEGGSVNRLAQTGLENKVDSAQTIGQTLDSQNAYAAGTTIGSYLSAYGFNLDFAPVADLSNVSGSIMEGRSYGSEAATASSFITAMMQGLEDQNVTACLKHFPGIGSSSGDTHQGMIVTERTEADFRAEEFSVFQAGINAGANMIMMGHISAPALTGDNMPCSMSKTVVTDILRGELSFDGVIITDALNMGAIAEYYGADEAAIMALKAGCDMLLMPEDFELAYEGVLEAVQNGTISVERIDDSLRRIYRIKYQDKLQE